MSKTFSGVIPPVVTPYNEAGGLDTAALARHHDRLIAHGVGGIFVLGTTGEGPALPRRLREAMLAESIDHAAGRVPVLAGISAAGLDDSLELARFAARHGADAVVAAPPCYLAPADRELVEFYRILTLEQPLPVFVYNRPGTVKITMSPELIAEIAQIPGIAGCKDSAGDFPAFRRTRELVKDRKDFVLLIGPDARLGDALDAGAQGGVTSGANFAPALYVGMYRAQQAGDRAAMARFQQGIDLLQKLYTCRENICCGVVAGLKYALARTGFMRPDLIPPFLTRKSDAELDAVVDKLAAEYPL